jgi:hypothetical protein
MDAAEVCSGITAAAVFFEPLEPLDKGELVREE